MGWRRGARQLCQNKVLLGMDKHIPLASLNVLLLLPWAQSPGAGCSVELRKFKSSTCVGAVRFLLRNSFYQNKGEKKNNVRKLFWCFQSTPWCYIWIEELVRSNSHWESQAAKYTEPRLPALCWLLCMSPWQLAGSFLCPIHAGSWLTGMAVLEPGC